MLGYMHHEYSKATEIWANLCGVHLELVLNVIYPLPEKLYQEIDHFVPIEAGCLHMF